MLVVSAVHRVTSAHYTDSAEIAYNQLQHA